MWVLSRSLWLAVVLVLVHPAIADVGVEMDCPLAVPAQSAVATNVRLENRECSDVNVRLISSVAGNESDTLGAIAVRGPQVTSEIVVPAATDNFPPHCFFVTPGVADVELTAPPLIPQGLEGTVAMFVLMAEWNVQGEAQTTTEVSQCLVDVRAACFGDLDQDGLVNNRDALRFRTCFGCTENCNPNCDSNGDGIVNNSDALAFRQNFGRACP